jgi:hypothetical protein
MGFVNGGDSKRNQKTHSLLTDWGDLGPGQRAGGVDVSASLERIAFAVLAGAVKDMRSMKDTRRLYLHDGSIDLDEYRRLSPERRGELLSAAGLVASLAPSLGIIPEGAVKLSKEVLKAEWDSPYRQELYAAAVAGQAWKAEEMEGETSRIQGCLRCGIRCRWLPVLTLPEDTPAEMTWRLGRPENHIPVCKKCRKDLGLGKEDKSKDIDLAWSLWAARFEGLWQWYLAEKGDRLPKDWDREEYPLWPKEYGGAAWETGSGHLLHCAPRGPRGIIRTKAHEEAFARVLDDRKGDTPFNIVLD